MKIRNLREYVLRELWLIPGVMLVASVLLAWVTWFVDRYLQSEAKDFIGFAWSPEAARTILSTVAGSMLTITAVVFSITILVLQLASSQFSPRALRTFLRDASSKVTLGMLLGTFAYSLTALSFVRTTGEVPFVPTLTVALVFVAVFASLLVLIFFIDHVAVKIQVSSIIKSIGDETIDAIERNLTREPSAKGVTADDLLAKGVVHPVRSVHSGAIVKVDTSAIVDLATQHDIIVELTAGVGDFVPVDAVIVRLSREVDELLVRRLLKHVHQATERTLEQDIGFGFRQLTDIGLRALSPAMNDPTTAMNVIDAVHDLLRRLGKRGDEECCHCSATGALRLVIPTTGWQDYLRMLFDEIGSAGEGFPTIRARLEDAAEDLIDYLPVERGRDVRRVAAQWLK